MRSHSTVTEMADLTAGVALVGVIWRLFLIKVRSIRVIFGGI